MTSSFASQQKQKENNVTSQIEFNIVMELKQKLS